MKSSFRLDTREERKDQWFREVNAKRRSSRKYELAKIIRRLRDEQGFSYAEIAKMRGTTAAKIRSYVV